MKAIHTTAGLCILAFCLIGCRPTEKENLKGTNEDNLEAVLNGAGREVPVDASTHIRFENQTRSRIAVKFGSTAHGIEPGSIVYIPEEYEDKNRGISVKIAQHKDGEWNMVYASKWVTSEKRIESYVANETTTGKFTMFGTRGRIEETKKSNIAPERAFSSEITPRRRVIIEEERPNQAGDDNTD